MEGGIAAGLASAFTLVNLWYALVGCILGTIVGVLPGLGPSSAMSILLPVAVHLPPEGAIIIMAGIYYGAMYGGSTTAILINIPGEVSSVVTAVDGFAMTRNGRAGEALAIAGIGSFIAGIAGTIAIALLGPVVADIALKFGPQEYLGLVTFSMVALIGFAGDQPLKGLTLAILGMFLATLGADPLTGTQRLTYGTVELSKGLDIVPVLVGLFGIGEVLMALHQNVSKIFTGNLGRWTAMIPRGLELTRGIVASVRGTLLGFGLGLLPGMLPAVTAYLAYDMEKRIAVEPARFGKGAIEGVAAPEAANNATAMAGFIPLLSLGIPTSPALAIMLGTLMINGLTPGPMLFEQKSVLVWTVIGSMFIANAMLLILNLPLVGIWARLSVVPYSVMAPVVLAVCVIGAYAPRNTMFDVWVAIAFGVIGFVMRRLAMPLTPLVLGFLLGPLFEQSLRQSVSMSGGSLLHLVNRPIAIAFLGAAVMVLIVVAVMKRRSAAIKTLMHDSAAET
ncbi:MAG: tripartite tricarboxylate transporter permease [Hyphomicrobiaceae bacterium]